MQPEGGVSDGEECPKRRQQGQEPRGRREHKSYKKDVMTGEARGQVTKTLTVKLLRPGSFI